MAETGPRFPRTPTGPLAHDKRLRERRVGDLRPAEQIGEASHCAADRARDDFEGGSGGKGSVGQQPFQKRSR